MPPAAIKARFYTWRPAMASKMLQLIFEVPLAQQAAVLEYLGAPNPEAPTEFGIAKLNTPSVESNHMEVEKAQLRPIEGETPASRAIKMAHTHAGGSEEVLQGIREYCGVKSCSEFKTNPGAVKRFHDWEYINGYVQVRP
jgi:hypothetical protein